MIDIKILMYIFVGIVGILLCMNGYHSIDLSYNNQMGYDDCTLSGKIITNHEMYANGWKQIILGTLFIVISSFVIGINFMPLSM